MATSRIPKGSIKNAIIDHVCTFCEEDGQKAEAHSCCNTCNRLMCDSCKTLHGQLYDSHAVLAEHQIDQWTIHASSDLCTHHPTLVLDMFCHDHDQLACRVCVPKEHRSCKNVQHVSEAARKLNKSREYKQVLKTTSVVIHELWKLGRQEEANKLELRQKADKIRTSMTTQRQELEKLLKTLEDNTNKTLDSLLSKLELGSDTKINKSMFFDIELTRLAQRINNAGNSDTVAIFRNLKKLQDATTDAKDFLRDASSVHVDITFTPNKEIEEMLKTIETLGAVVSSFGELSNKSATYESITPSVAAPIAGQVFRAKNVENTESGDEILDVSDERELADNNTVIADADKSKIIRKAKKGSGKLRSKPSKSKATSSEPNPSTIAIHSPDHVYQAEKVKKYDMKTKNDRRTPWIYGICVLSDGNTVIADYNNDKIKLLNNKYKVIDEQKLYFNPKSLCHITGSEVAVNFSDCDKAIFELMFINVVKGNITLTRRVNVSGSWGRMVHRDGLLYAVNYGIHIYNIADNRQKKLFTGYVDDVAVSHKDQLVYVTGYDEGLTVLNNDGKVLSNLREDELGGTRYVAIAGNETLFVAGFNSNTIIQVDKEGSKKMGTLATASDGVMWPKSLCVNYKTNELIEGQENGIILVIKLK